MRIVLCKTQEAFDFTQSLVARMQTPPTTSPPSHSRPFSEMPCFRFEAILSSVSVTVTCLISFSLSHTFHVCILTAGHG